MGDQVLREKQILERLLETSSALLNGRSEQEVLDRILQGVQALGFDRVRLYLLSEDGQSMLGKAQAGMDGHFLGIEWSVAEDSYMQSLLANPRPQIFRRQEDKPIPFEELLGKEGVDQWVCVPLLRRGEVIGKLSADNKFSGRPIAEEELEPLALFSSQAAAAIENARLFAEAERRTENLRAVLRVSTTVSSSLDLDQTLRTACQAAVELFGVSHSGLVLFAPDQTSGKVCAEYPDKEMVGLTISLQDAPAEQLLINSKDPLIIHDVKSESSLGPVRDILLNLGIHSILIVPVVSKERVLGSFSLDAMDQKRVFKREEIELCKVFAAQLAVAIENAQLFEETKQRAEQLEALRRTTLDLTSSLDRDALLRTIIQHAMELLKAKGGGIYKYYPERNELTIVTDYKRLDYVGKTLKVGEGMAGRLVRSDAPSMIIEDYNKWWGRAPIYDDTGHFGAVLEVKLKWQESVVGILYIDDEVGRKFTSEDIRLLSLFADQAAIALIKVDLLAKDNEKVKRLEKLSLATKEIMDNLGKMSLDDRLTLIAKHAADILEAETSGIFLVKQPNFLSLEASYGHVKGGFQKGKTFAIRSGSKTGLTGHIAAEGELFNAYGDELVNHPAARGSIGSHLPSGQCYSLLAIPLKKQIDQKEKLVGLLRIDNKKDRHGSPSLTLGFTQEDEWILTIFAETVLVAIDAAGLVKELSGQKNHLERLVASSPNGIVANDTHGLVTEFNGQAEQILGYSAREAMQMHVREFFSDPNAPLEIGKLLRASHDGKLRNHETFVKDRNGTRIPIRLSTTWLYDGEQKRIGAVGYFEDLRFIDLLLKASNAVSYASNLTEGLRSLAEMIASHLSRTFCRILLTDESETSLTVKAAYPLPDTGSPLGWNPGLGQHIALADRPDGLRDILKDGRPRVLRLNDERVQNALREFSQRLSLKQDLYSVLMIPLNLGNRIIGLIELGELQHEEEKLFTKGERDLVSAIAAQIAGLINSITLHDATERRRQLLAALDGAALSIRAEKEQFQLQREIVAVAAKLVGCTTAGLWSKLPHLQKLELIGACGALTEIVGSRLSYEEGLVGLVAGNGESKVIYNYSAWPSREAVLEPYGFNAVVGVPLQQTGEVESVLFISYEEHQQQYAEADREILERFAAQASKALQVSRLMGWEQWMLRQSTILRQISNYVQSECSLHKRSEHSLDKMSHAVLTGITAGYGLGFNRAALLVVDKEGESLMGQMGIGHITESEARDDWAQHLRLGMENFGKYLEVIEQGPFPTTPLAERIRALCLSLKFETSDLFSRIIQERRETIVSPGEIDSLPRDFIEAFAPDRSLPLVIVPLVAQEQLVGVLVADNKFTQAPVAVTDSLLRLANTMSVAIANICMSLDTRSRGEQLSPFPEPSNAVEFQEVLRQIVRGAREVWRADSAAIWLYDTDRKQFSSESSIADGISAEDWEQARGAEPQWRLTAQTVIRLGWVGIENIDDVQQQDEEVLVEVSRIILEQIGIRSFQGIALTVGREALGVLYVNYNLPRSFSEDDRELARAFADYAAAALKSAKLLDHVNKAKKTAEQVAQVTAHGKLSETLVTIVHGTKAAVDCDSVTLYVYDQIKERLDHPPTMEGVKYPDRATQNEEVPADSIVNKMREKSGPYIIEKIEEDPLFKSSRFVRDEGIRSCIAIPLRVIDQQAGVMFVNYRVPHRFTADELINIELFANQAAVAIHYAQLYKQLQRRVEALRVLYEASHAITGSLDLGQILIRIAEQAWRLIGGQEKQITLANIWLVEDKKVKLKAAYPDEGAADPDTVLPRELDLEKGSKPLGVIVRTINTKTSQIVKDVSRDPDYVRCNPNIKSELAVPINSTEGIAIGVINVEHSELDASDKDDVLVLEALSSQAAIAIQNAQTMGMVGTRTAIAWMGMAQLVLGHSITNLAASIGAEVELLYRDLGDEEVPRPQSIRRLAVIDEIVKKIREKPITSVLSAKEGVEPVLVSDLIQSHVRELQQRQQLEKKPDGSVQYYLDLETEERLTVSVNRQWITEALKILTDNAIKAMADSRIKELSIMTRRKDGNVEIQIRDTGRGIPEDIRPYLFQKPILRGQGTGVGLLLAQLIVQTYGGGISVGPPSSTNTTMTIRLPLMAS